MPNLYVTLFHIMKSSTNLILTERERKIILLLNDPITIDTIIIITCKKQTSITSRSEYVYVCVCVFVRVQFNLFRIYIFPMIKLSSIDNHYYFVKNSIILFL